MVCPHPNNDMQIVKIITSTLLKGFFFILKNSEVFILYILYLLQSIYACCGVELGEGCLHASLKQSALNNILGMLELSDRFQTMHGSFKEIT